MLEAVLRKCRSASSLLAGAGGDSHARSLLTYIAYAWGTNWLTAGTIAGHLAAVKFFHHQERGLELFLRHPWIVYALKGATRSRADVRTKPRIRRPVVWIVLLAGESLCHQWGPGGWVLWLALGASFFFLAPAGEMFASKEGCWDDGHMLRRKDMVFFRGSIQLDWTMWGQADRVVVRFRNSKGDQLRYGMVMMRARTDSHLPLRDGGGAVELMVELLSSFMSLPSLAPLAAFGTVQGNWSVWTQAGATALPFAEWCRWRDCRRMGTRCTPCVLGASPSCRREGRRSM